MVYNRNLPLPAPGTETFFLWGPRQTGKSTHLRATYGTDDALWLDLLDTPTYRRLATHPEELQERVRAQDARFVIIDEVQKIPALLDEVHRLHERGIRFALCGSSAQKVRHGHANLLGGRALRLELFGLVSAELGDRFDLTHLLNAGTLPRIYDASRPDRYLRSYIADYLKEEIVAEGLIKGLSPFDDFLRQAALSDTQPVNMSTIARECGISAPTVRSYFQILEDTLLGRFLPAYTHKPRRRVIKAPKFFFFDVGVVNRLAKRGHLEAGSELYGKAFENWVFHELSAFNSYHERDADLSYWRLSTGVEVDFVVNHFDVAIECKASRRIRPSHLKNLRELKKDHPETQRQILVSLAPHARTTEDGIEILGYQNFAAALWRGDVF
ncbi:MAG: ATP-binding protein [Deltaproteobacteria bacterium]|nr:ATP-binding protein [Deltaproteobacteria bacterium]